MNNYTNPFPDSMPTQGMIKQGPVTPGTRIPVARPDMGDGAYSTVESRSYEGNPGEPTILLATTANDGSRMLSPQETWEQFRKDGSNLMGVFKTPRDADNYGQAFHNWDAFLYDNGLDLPTYIQKSTGLPMREGEYKRRTRGLLEAALRLNGYDF